MGLSQDSESQIPGVIIMPCIKIVQNGRFLGYLHVSPTLAHTNKADLLLPKIDDRRQNPMTGFEPRFIMPLQWLDCPVHEGQFSYDHDRQETGRMLCWGRGRRSQRDGRFSNMFTHKYIYIYNIIVIYIYTHIILYILYCIVLYYIMLYYIIYTYV